MTTTWTGSAGRTAIAAGGLVVLLIAMGFGTKVVRVGSSSDVGSDVFSPERYGSSEFPKVQSYVESHAVDAATLATALDKDPAAAAKQYGVSTESGVEFPVKFTGKAGNQDSGVYDVAVPGLPGKTEVTVQTGPAISGTDLRDASGAITFGQFRNQIEYQNAGAALNKAMKKSVLSKIDTGHLGGKTVAIVGVFDASDPGTWLVTPVKLDVQ